MPNISVKVNFRVTLQWQTRRKNRTNDYCNIFSGCVGEISHKGIHWMITKRRIQGKLLSVLPKMFNCPPVSFPSKINFLSKQHSLLIWSLIGKSLLRKCLWKHINWFCTILHKIHKNDLTCEIFSWLQNIQRKLHDRMLCNVQLSSCSRKLLSFARVGQLNAISIGILYEVSVELYRNESDVKEKMF